MVHSERLYQQEDNRHGRLLLGSCCMAVRSSLRWSLLWFLAIVSRSGTYSTSEWTGRKRMVGCTIRGRFRSFLRIVTMEHWFIRILFFFFDLDLS